MSAAGTLRRSKTETVDSPGSKARGVDRPGAMPYLLILPGFVFYAAFVLAPIVGTLRLSFVQWDGLLPEKWVGFSNYVQILKDPAWWTSTTVALTFVVFSCLLPVAVALVLTGIIARTKIRGLSILRFLYFLPYVVALAVVAITWRWLFATSGTINLIVGAIFGKGRVVAYLGDMNLALPALGIVAFWTMFGFVCVMLLSGTQHIPHELFEAARMDGAGPVREFLAVTLPGIRHELRVSLVLTFILALRTFDLPMVATQGGPGDKTTTPSLLMFRDVFLNLVIGKGAAIAVLVTIGIAVGVSVINRALRAED